MNTRLTSPQCPHSRGLFLLWEKGCSKESPWHPFLSTVWYKKIVPAKKTMAAVGTKKSPKPHRRQQESRR
jgi:hypothetical protein